MWHTNGIVLDYIKIKIYKLSFRKSYVLQHSLLLKKKPAPKPASPLHKQKGENLTENNQKVVDFCNATKI